MRCPDKQCRYNMHGFCEKIEEGNENIPELKWMPVIEGEAEDTSRNVSVPYRIDDISAMVCMTKVYV